MMGLKNSINQRPRRAAKQAGDTIIEVLFAMSIVGIVLGSAFGMMNLATKTGRSAQERTEALKVAESQLELLKKFYKINPAAYQTLSASNPAHHFCVTDDPAAHSLASERAPTALADVCTNTNGNEEPGLYSIDITPNESGNTGTYLITITWTLINSKGPDPGRVSIYYRMGTL